MEVAARRDPETEDQTLAATRNAPARLLPGTAWRQLVKFCVVGASGYVVNLAVFAPLVHLTGLNYLVAAVASFLAAVANNYTWNRLWTFRSRGSVGRQAIRFLAVSSGALGANVACLAAFVALGAGEVPAQAAAIVVVAPLSFLGNKLWTFGGTSVPVAWLAREAIRLVEREPFLLPLVALYVFALVRLAPFELVQDSWLTLVSGREIAQNGLPETEHLTVFAEGARWIDQQWLAHLAFYALFALGGLKGALLIHVLLLTGAFSLALVAARRLGASPGAVFWVGAGSFFLAPWTWQLRSQSFAYVLFVAVLWLLARDSRSPDRRVFFVLPLLILWANLHGSVVLGAGLVALRGLTEVLARPPSAHRLRRGAALLGLPALCVLASPYGLSLLGYYRDMLVGPEFARIVGEWRPPTIHQAWPFFFLALAAVWLVARSGPRLTLFEKLAVLATIVGGFLAMRSITWFALAWLVLVPLAAAAVRPGRTRARRPGAPLRLLSGLSALAVPGAFLALLLVPGSAYESRWPNDAVRAVSRVTDPDPSVRVFASERYADWLLWEKPDLAGRVAYDVRFELHSEAQLRALFRYKNRIGRDWQAIARGYDIVVLDRQTESKLEQPLLEAEGARRLYADELVSVLYRPTS